MSALALISFVWTAALFAGSVHYFPIGLHVERGVAMRQGIRFRPSYRSSTADIRSPA